MKTVRLLSNGHEYSAEADVDAPPDSIPLDGAWDVRLEPTMDNRWGDYRHPPEETTIGPEARQFRYAEEDGSSGASPDWHERTLDDSAWERVTWGYGPYWWTLGPFREGHEPQQVLQDTIAGGFDPCAPVHAAGRQAVWEPLVFSLKHGSQTPDISWGGMEGVRDEFITCPAVLGGGDVVRYLFTYVDAPEEAKRLFEFGRLLDDYHRSVGAEPFARSAWINSEQVVSAAAADPQEPVPVTLRKGLNAVLLRIVQPRGETVSARAAFVDPDAVPDFDPYVPLLRWFRESPVLTHDVTPGIERVGWFRFDAPPGLASMRTKLFGKRVRVWVDGESVHDQIIECSPPDKRSADVEIQLSTPIARCSQVSLRVETVPGCYGGAVFDEPVVFDCQPGEIEAGDWCDQGLEAYSGALIYTRSLTLDQIDPETKIILDLGRAAVVAEVSVNGKPAGVRMARPYRFDITDLVTAGRNAVEVKVANTLGNHMSSYPSQRVHAGHTVSGMLGPVEVRFLRIATLTATETPA